MDVGSFLEKGSPFGKIKVHDRSAHIFSPFQRESFELINFRKIRLTCSGISLEWPDLVIFVTLFFANGTKITRSGHFEEVFRGFY